MNPRLARWAVPGVPFLLSLGLSLSTVGNGVFWQDSGFYLTAVKDFDVLYPPGFVLYLLLCKTWTLLLFFLDFTLAVHLFSSLCAALAAATLAVAARDLLLAKNPLFKVADADPDLAGMAGSLAGSIAAAGYTFWFTGIYAKGYALYYLILAQLLWRMIRAHESSNPKDLTWVAALIGLCWAAHPSSALLGIVLIAYVATHLKATGARGIAWRIGIAAACALGPSLLLPVLGAKKSLHAMGDPGDLQEFFRYLLGTVYTSRPGGFGWVDSRVASFGTYFWEEFLGVGVILIVAGLIALAKSNRRLLIGILLWLVPYSTVTILFKMEGQHDCWFVAAWMPLYLVVALGVYSVAKASPANSRRIVGALAVVSVAWSLAANGAALRQRDYILPEQYGRLLLDNLDPNAVLVVSGDEGVAITGYLQRVRGVRPDVAIVNATFLRAHNASGDWYLERLLKAYPFLKRPEAPEPGRETGSNLDGRYSVASFLNANLDLDRSVFSTLAPAPGATRPDLALVPAGVLWKMAKKGQEKTDPKYWESPITAEQVRAQVRRERGQSVEFTGNEVVVKPEGYERRLFDLLVGARMILANAHLKQGNFAQAARLMAGILELDPEKAKDVKFVYSYAHALNGLGEFAKAEPLFAEVLKRTSDPRIIAGSLLVLGKIHRRMGDEPGARRMWTLGLTVKDADPALRQEMERELNAVPK